jgi:hypothetical protein
MALITAASLTPRRIRRKNAQTKAEETITAQIVSPSPNAGISGFSVEVMSTQ